MLVSPCRNHSSSWMIERRCSFLVVSSGKTLGQVEAHLPAEHRARAGAGAVGFDVPVFEHVAHQVEVGAHGGSRLNWVGPHILVAIPAGIIGGRPGGERFWSANPDSVDPAGANPLSG
jgi:hypothetical protein